MSVRAVVFDLFDTLVDLHMDELPSLEIGGLRLRSTWGALHRGLGEHTEIDLETFADTLRAVDGELRKAYYARDRELPTIERFTELARRLALSDPSLPQALTLIHMQGIYDVTHFQPHHREVLCTLGRGRSLGVCSNFSHTPTAHRVIDGAGLAPSFDAVVISEEVGIRKPRAEIFDAVLAALGTAPEETVHVGDNLVADVEGASALGMRTVWVTRRIADPEAALAAHAGARPTWVVRDLGELPQLLG